MPESFTSLPSPPSPTTPIHLIFFITGNPGFIDYYTDFLSTLSTLLKPPSTSTSSSSSASSSPIFHIRGSSLPGFEEPPAPPGSPPLSLAQQIAFVQGALHTAIYPPDLPSRSSSCASPYASVILVGHSVGAFIALEVLQALRGKVPASEEPKEEGEDEAEEGAALLFYSAPSSSSPPPPPPPQQQQQQQQQALPPFAAILLFPTVTHIAQSANGRVFGALFALADFPRRAGALAGALLACVPGRLLAWVLAHVVGMPPGAATAATTKFLRSERGVWQAMHLARDELKTITADRWDADIWGRNSSSPPSPNPSKADNTAPPPLQLYFLFGKKDEWVADHTRDELIAARGTLASAERNDLVGVSSKPKMFIDQSGIPHAFCIKHSEVVAEKVKVWVEEIVGMK